MNTITTFGATCALGILATFSVGVSADTTSRASIKLLGRTVSTVDHRSVTPALAAASSYGVESKSGFKWGQPVSEVAPGDNSWAIDTSSSTASFKWDSSPRNADNTANTVAKNAGFQWKSSGFAGQAGFRWTHKSFADQAGFRWTHKSFAEQAGFRWTHKNFADQAGFRWTHKSFADQAGFRWTHKSFADQAGFRWTHKNIAEQAGFRWTHK